MILAVASRFTPSDFRVPCPLSPTPQHRIALKVCVVEVGVVEVVVEAATFFSGLGGQDNQFGSQGHVSQFEKFGESMPVK